MTDLSRGEVAITILNAILQGLTFEDIGLSEDHRAMWNQIDSEVDEIAARGDVIDVPNDQGMWPDVDDDVTSESDTFSLLSDRTFHMPGKHDQSSHGKGKTSQRNPNVVCGDCFKAGFDVITGGEVSNDARLVHGQPVGRGSENRGQRFWHAWVEDGDTVIDRSSGMDLEMPRDAYYALGRIDEPHVRRYSREEALDRAIDTGNYGPWEEFGDPDALDLHYVMTFHLAGKHDQAAHGKGTVTSGCCGDSEREPDWRPRPVDTGGE